MCDCLTVEETLVVAGQLLPKDNEVTDAYKELKFNYCPMCGTAFEKADQE